MKNKYITFRADANEAIGMGHVMRCLSIADSFRDAGCQIKFIIADDKVVSLIRNRGYKAIVLNSNFQAMDDELDLWPRDLSSDLLFIDSYYVTPTYLSSLRLKFRTENRGNNKTIYLDDVLSFPYPVDILINYNAFASLFLYKDLYSCSTIEQPQLILGATYTPLRPMFRGITHRVQPRIVKNILVSTGGSDEFHLTLTIIQNVRLHARNDRVYHLLIGALNADKDEIKRSASEYDNIVLHENVLDMKSLIQSADLAVSAAGSTLYEIAACGVPLITYSLADNQIPVGESFERLGLGRYIGDLRDPKSINPNLVMSGSLDARAVEKIMKATDELAEDWNRRCEIGKRMQELIDGFGAERIVEDILQEKRPLLDN